MRKVLLASIAAAAVAALAIGSLAIANGGKKKFSGDPISGYFEVPTLSTSGSGSFKARVNKDGTSFDYTLEYDGPFDANPAGGTVTQAHIHLGRVGINGGISVFLCTNLGNGPVDTPPCPPAPATITGTLDADDVVGPPAQGIAAGEFAELLDAMRSGSTYANIHTTTFGGGEIRAQIND